ncbi:hypothetical protein ACO0LB_17065 [Undibacterium sp. SXout7W]|uniref:hypothetical protein n=1 Tax=Undibacterium sp. SXout7W TaxID=3413049 RepID=UPI003BF2E4AD
MPPGSSLSANAVHEIGTGVILGGIVLVILLLLLLLSKHVSTTPQQQPSESKEPVEPNQQHSS